MTRILIFGIFAFLISCGGKSDFEIKEEKKLIRKQNKEKEIDKLIEEYNIQYCWDTLDFKYSINYKPVINTNYQLIKDPYILDIAKYDSNYVVSVRCGYYPRYYFNLFTSNNKEINKLNKMNSKDPESDILLVVSVEEIKKGLFEINAIPEGEDFASIEIDYSGDFQAKGKLLQIKTIK